MELSESGKEEVMEGYSNEKYSDAVNKNRVELSEVIPMELPLSINIDICDMCNFECKFCAAHSSKDRKFSKMNMNDFNIILENLSCLRDNLKKFTFCGYGEPTMNEMLPHMIKNVRKNLGKEVEIDLVTNGSILKEELCRELSESGVNRIMISVEALDDERYYEITNRKIKYITILENVERLYRYCAGKCEIFVKTVDISIKNENEKKRWKRFVRF